MKTRTLRTLTAAFVALQCASGAAAAGPSKTEMLLDLQAYQVQQPQLVARLPEDRIMGRAAARIAPVAQRLYQAPFAFYLTKESEPDAYSYYGPRVYVSRGMVDYADNMEELAGVMCHEVSHVLHHDGTRSDRSTTAENAKVRSFLHRAMRVTHNHLARALDMMTGTGAKLAELRYSRSQEEAADLSGATVCSQAGSNPWGIVWMLQKLQAQTHPRGLSWFSDHPTLKARIARLTKVLRRNTAFAMWTPDEAVAATPIKR